MKTGQTALYNKANLLKRINLKNHHDKKLIRKMIRESKDEKMSSFNDDDFYQET